MSRYTQLQLPLLPLLLLLLLLGRAASESLHANSHDHDQADDDQEDGFDQERFLGKDRAQEFKDLNQEESLAKLMKLIDDEVDLDKDGFVSEPELLQHLDKMFKQQTEKDISANWQDMQPTGNELTWRAYAESLQPGLFDESASAAIKDVATKAVQAAAANAKAIDITIPAEISSDDRVLLEEYFRDLLKQRRRWHAADKNADDKITKEEYGSLLFPEGDSKMREVMVAEALEGMDKDGDGFLSKEEYIADAWKPSSETEQEPKWLQDERTDFDSKKDLNKDGKLDKEEISAWLFDPNTSTSGSVRTEASHLMSEADKDKDNKLSKEEIKQNHDLFAGSQATNFGDDIDAHERDEL